MTQIVGIVHREGILIASESQYTTGDRQKTFDAKKVSVLRLKNGDVILAECGNVSLSNRAVRYIKDATNDIEITGEDSIAKIIEDVVNKIRVEILKGYPERNYSETELDEIFSAGKHMFGLMFAYFFKPPRSEESPHSKPIPCLYKITLYCPLAERLKSYGVMGADDRLAIFILKQFKCEELSWGEASCLAVDALERIKDDDNTCGGEIMYASIDPLMFYQPIAGISEGKFVGRILTKLEVMRAKNDERYKTELGAVMKEIHEESVKEYMEQLNIGQREENRWKIEHGLRIRHKCSKCNCSFEVSTKEQPVKDAHCPTCGNIDPINL